MKRKSSHLEASLVGTVLPSQEPVDGMRQAQKLVASGPRVCEEERRRRERRDGDSNVTGGCDGRMNAGKEDGGGCVLGGGLRRLTREVESC